MIKNYVVKCAILLTFLRIVCGESTKCPTNYWPCKNGHCIRNEELCDGAIHCTDGSDESVDQCLLIPCPSYAFQCAYGGCITGNFKCNGIKDCADGSDENKYLCNTDLNFGKEIQGTCKKPLEMQCKSGECISSNGICDGWKDCQDGSDETVELCSFEKCPHDSFRCGYGACIAGSKKCNYISDCLDGSDEFANVCVLGYRSSVNHTLTSNKTTQLFALGPIYTVTTIKPIQMSHISDSADFLPAIIQNNLLNSTNNCELYYWPCKNGQCIRSEEVCDGATHCTDSSDETVEQCLHTACPSFAFRCTYGGCITGNFKCNGIEDCADGSDENRYLCNTDFNFQEDIQGICKSASAMECKSGECIDNDKVCDGQKHCPDGSDETVELCNSFNCPPFAFRCGYGACIAGTAQCNGVNDCMDGSDELPAICSTNATTVKPTTSTDDSFAVTNEYCSSHTLKSGISTQKACFYNNNSVSCYHHLRPGTKANITCAFGYVERRQKKKHHIIKCENNGEWNNVKAKCSPECGTLTEDQKNNAIKPWDLSIFKRNYIGLYSPICSAVIVSPKVVLTAAKCLMNHDDNGYVTDHVFYNVIQGYYNMTYRQGDHLNVAVHNISKISIKRLPRTADLAVLILVNYFEFSNYLKPICLPNIEIGQQSLSDNNLNIGRPYVRDNSRIHLEFLTACGTCERITRLANYVNIYHFLPFINREIKYYNYLL